MKKIIQNSQEGIKLTGIFNLYVRDAKTGRIKRRYQIKNLVPTVGRAAIANQLSSTSPSPDPLYIAYVELGTGTTAAANGDTALQTPIYRNAVASRTNANNIAYISGFFSSTETSGTYREIGLFIGGSGTLGTGTLFSRTIINITKSATETLTFDYTLTIS